LYPLLLEHFLAQGKLTLIWQWNSPDFQPSIGMYDHDVIVLDLGPDLLVLSQGF
jgi:hypothetical protein